jgi:type IV secretory pathway VirJ component
VSAHTPECAPASTPCRLALALCALLLCQCASVGRGPTVEITSVGPFSSVHLYRPQGGARRLALVLSGDRGWSYHIAGVARGLATDGTLVAGVDVRAELAQLRSEPAACVSPGADLAALARELERRFGLTGGPVIVGHSAGATLAYVALVQAAPGTFAGAITLSFCADLDLVKPLCAAAPVPSVPRSGGVHLVPPARLPAPWIALHGLDDGECPPSDSQDFAAAIPNVQFVPLPGVTHSYTHRERWWDRFIEAYRTLAVQPVSDAAPQQGELAAPAHVH